MEMEQIKNIIKEYFVNPPSDFLRWRFSDSWIDSVLKKTIKKINNNSTQSDVLKITNQVHKKEFENLNKELNSYFKSKWRNAAEFDIEDAVDEEIINLIECQDYNPKLSNEKKYLKLRIENRLIDIYNKSNKCGTEITSEPFQEAIYPVDINYLSELRTREDKSLIHVLNHLYIVKPLFMNSILSEDSLLKIKHSFPSKEFLTKDLPSEFKFLRDLKDYRFLVKGYAGYEKIIQAQERQFMMLAIELLKNCRENFYSVILPHKIEEGFDRIKVIKRTPLLSAVAVDVKGNVIKTAYKGETGCMESHCEYTLFEEIFTDIDKVRIQGGTLYVTLEPCNKRGFYTENGVEKPKIPCAVRCVEVGIQKIYIGTRDPDATVNWKGANTLNSGTYSFDIDKKNNPLGKDDNEKKAASLLMDEFDRRKYTYIQESGKKVYKIGTPVEINLFHHDLSLEVMLLNKEFLKGKEEDAFPSLDKYKPTQSTSQP